ncbi:hypothetical protein B566_EDAN002997 [Ephemera danica]|nr:hypothetical protein B566_EDAN002997 [Ephemera danica]
MCSFLFQIVFLLVLTTLVAISEAGGGGGGKEHVHLKIHVPHFVKHLHHTKTVYIHHHKKGHGGGGGGVPADLL